MARLSKYFTPALVAADKQRILEMVGLKNTVFQLAEKTGQNTVMIQTWSEKGSLTQISDLSAVGEISGPDVSMPQVSVNYVAANVASLENGSQRAVFEQILPYPYNMFFGEKRPDYEILFAPDDFMSKIGALRAAAIKLEQELSKFELGVLWIRGKECSLPLLFHFVRKKLIRVGTLSTLGLLTEKFEKQQLTPMDLRQFFGTNAAFFELKLNNFESLSCSWDALRGAISRTLNDPSSRVLGESLLSPESPAFLDFEL
jgi:hypothetical protein